ncbi:hypothetical protein ACMXYV_08295 [Neptuniibacter sp. SY11_33]|uniref:hypothetical protein n=1 Tax=Neptuniibacter sp. SY11_33 TaxID=3398215 RepID=UPI0039F56C11
MLTKSGQISTAKRYRLVEQCFGSALESHGFTTDNSKTAVFWRKTEGNIYHYVVAWRAKRSPKYDILAFAHSPLLDEEFSEKHPDNIGCPMHGHVHSKRGVGFRSEKLFCRTEEGFLRDFEKRGRAMLSEHAVPFLDKIQTLNDLAPLITAVGAKEKLNKALQPING